MPEYRLSPDAEADLESIARYTVETWGTDQAREYQTGLVSCFKAIASGTARTTVPIAQRPEFCSLHCQHHYVFALLESGEPVSIIAVLHENMDLPTRLRERLEGH